MKRLMIAAMAMAAGAAFADTEIASANVVGYFTKAQKTTDDFKVISFQWATTDDKATKSIQDAIKPTMAGQAWVDPENDDECIPGWTDHAPAIQIRDAIGGYDYAWYAKDGYDLDTDEVYPAWCNDEGYVLKTMQVALGQAAWIANQTEEDGSWTICGAVAGAETPVGGKADVFLLQGGAFPVEFKINDAEAVTWTLTGGQAWVDPENDDECIPGWTDNAPAIQIRDEIGGYDYAWYAKDGYDLDTDEVYPAWCNDEGYVLKNTKVPVGAGFWLWAPEENPNVFVTVKNPIK